MIKAVPILVLAWALLALGAGAAPSVAQPKSAPEVQSVVPSSNVVLAKGDSTWITLKGTNFIYVSAVELVRADKDYIKGELEASLRNFFLSEYFRSAFLPIFGGHVQTLFGGARVNFIDVYAASAGGMKLVGTTRLVR